ncbi:MAG TPA: ATP-binding protein [Thermoanaerobaculia bacterium]|jgi:signal transduction histidine kinase/CheY-like chemotaxis protein
MKPESTFPLFSIPVESEEDVVLARQRARQVADALSFDSQDQIRIATAVSEIARNAYSYAGGGIIDFRIDGTTAPQLLQIIVRDRGSGIRNLDEILSGKYHSKTGMGLGIVGARRLLDRVDIESSPKGTTIALKKLLPPRSATYTGPQLQAMVEMLMRDRRRTPMEEVRQQNLELVSSLGDLRKRQDDLEIVNRELEDTNRGVLALYAELDEKAEHLRRADEMKTKFLSNMTHEFRTPLNSILALSKLLLDEMDGPLTEEQQKQVTFVRKAAADLSELVNDLLDIAKIEAGKITVRPKEFHVSDLFSALRGMLRPLLINSSLALSFDDATELPPMYTDEAKVSQVLRNFISNALKFTEEGEIRVSARHDPLIDSVEFAVSDTGIGIAPEDRELIFREFTQVENRLQHRVRGTGLGLPLTKKLVDLLGGKVTLESEFGAGSTFRASFPRVYAPPTAPMAALAESPDDPRIPVLFVEDNVETLMVYEKFLEGTPFRAMPARNLREARHGLTLRPKVVVLDVLLIGDDTWTLLAELKNDLATRNTPIVVITEVEDQHKAIALGASAFANKPVTREWLVHTLEQLTTKWHILLIDDDEASRYVLSRALGELRCDIAEAGTGMEGLLRSRHHVPDLIFLDLNLPEMSGVEVLQRLKNDPVTANVPVIVYTSRHIDDVLSQELRGKASVVLSKQHYDRDAVVTAVKQLLPLGAA